MHRAQEIVENAEWFLQGVDLDQGCLSFVRTNRQALAAASFLDQRFNSKDMPRATLKIAEVSKVLNASSKPLPAPPRFIFHTAFCCSTLLARCIDLPGSSLSLKEPEVLMTLANYQRINHKYLSDAKQASEIFILVAQLLFRPFANGESVVVKPTNTVNNVIGPLMRTHPQARALLLHSDLQSFLISSLKKGEQGRGFARQLFNIFLMDSVEAQQLSSKQLISMTDMQIASITWHLQLEHFIDAVGEFDQRKVKSLHCDRLLSDPDRILLDLVRHFELSQLEQNFNNMLENAPLKQNAKTPGKSFTAQDRKSQYQETEKQYAQSLELITNWAKQLRFKHGYTEKIGTML